MHEDYKPDNWMACYQLVLGLGRWAGSIFLYVHGILPFWLFSIIQGLNVMHIFIIYHDMGHNSFFTNAKLNYYGNLFLSWFVGTPFYWVIYHKLHHGRSGDLSKKPKEWNDTIFLTVEQYKELPSWKQWVYRVVRDPIFFFTVVPILNWYVKYRIPFSFNPPTKEVSRSLVFFSQCFEHCRTCWNGFRCSSFSWHQSS